MSFLEDLYRNHHKTRRGPGFVLLGEERGVFLQKYVGKEKHVLDIGCRDGALTEYYKDGNEVLGLDIDSEALAGARERLGIQVQHVDLNNEWGVPEKSFDVVVAAEVIEHLYYPEKIMGNIVRVLKDDGMLVGTVPNAFSIMHRVRYLTLRKKGTPLEDPTHINHFTVGELRDLLRRHFHEVTVEGIGRLGLLAQIFPQLFAFNLCFVAKYPK